MTIFTFAWCSPCLFTLSSLCVYPCVQISPFYKKPSYIGLEPILITSVSVHYLHKDPISKDSHILRYWGLLPRLSHERQWLPSCLLSFAFSLVVLMEFSGHDDVHGPLETTKWPRLGVAFVQKPSRNWGPQFNSHMSEPGSGSCSSQILGALDPQPPAWLQLGERSWAGGPS